MKRDLWRQLYVWKRRHWLANWGFHTPNFGSLHDLLQTLMTSTTSKLHWVLIFSVAVYQNWRGSAKKHGRPYGTPTTMVATIFETLTAVNINPNPIYEQWSTNRPHRVSHLPSWCPPPRWIKVNVDGALLSSGLGGVGVVFKNHLGHFIKTMGSTIEHWDSSTVDLNAILFLKHSLDSWMYNTNDSIIEGDNLMVIKYMQKFLKNAN